MKGNDFYNSVIASSNKSIDKGSSKSSIGYSFRMMKSVGTHYYTDAYGNTVRVGNVDSKIVPPCFRQEGDLAVAEEEDTAYGSPALRISSSIF